jgi:hypothetical protein
MNTTIINKTKVPDQQRVHHTAALFGVNFPLHLEPVVYAITGNISDDYHGGYWKFYKLSNGGFYMAPDSGKRFKVSCENGFEGELSADALGITACLYAYSHQSFGGGAFAETCAGQYHLLRDYMLEHSEARVILGAID